MANADIRNPIVINATTATLIQSGDFLRSVCFVSCGDTNLEVGKYLQVSKNEYSSLLNGDKTDFAYRLQNFFAYASNKLGGIIELGAQPITPATPSKDNLLAFDETLADWDNSKWLAYVYDLWKANETELIFKAWIETQDAFVQSNYEQWLKDNKKGAASSLALLQEYAKTLSLGDYPTNYYEYLEGSETSFKQLETYANLLAFSKGASNLPSWTQEAYDAYLITIGTKSKDYSEKIAALQDFIDNGNTRNYIYALPKEFYEFDGTSGLTKAYIDTNAKQYFALVMPSSAVNDGSLAKYEGQKSVLMFYENGSNATNSVIGATLGKFASAQFDISASLKASPLNYKFLNGFSFTELEGKTQRALIQANVTYVSSKAGNTLIMNGRCMDTRPFDYWYQWDLTAFAVETSVISLILNGVNNPNYVVQYNQNGIDTITSSVVATLNNQISKGCVTEFGATFNSATNELENIGYIVAIDYYSYIAAMPEDYQNEIYGGISFYIRIGRYIRQVVLNVTLN